MKRLLIKLAIFLLLGVIINVAVAWTAATFVNLLHQELPRNGLEVFHDRNVKWEISTWQSVTSFRLSSMRARAASGEFSIGFTPTGLIPAWVDLDESMDGFTQSGRYTELQWHDARGWPTLTLQCHGGADDQMGKQYLDGGIPLLLPPWQGRGHLYARTRALPVAPLWPGFAINTIFYALLLWGLFALPFAIRRRRRIKRGLCARCAYPVGSSSVCSECGTLEVHCMGMPPPATPARDYR